jgi:Tfp pilus assembly major pilin PilA
LCGLGLLLTVPSFALLLMFATLHCVALCYCIVSMYVCCYVCNGCLHYIGLGLCSVLFPGPNCSLVPPPLQIVLTDIPEVVPLLEVNISLNKLLCAHDASSQEVEVAVEGVKNSPRSNIFESYVAMPHCWGDSVDELNKVVSSFATTAATATATATAATTATFTTTDTTTTTTTTTTGSYGGLLLVASDVVYDPLGYRPLVTSITALLLHHQALHLDTQQQQNSDPSTHSQSQPPLMVLAHRHRNSENIKCVT